MSFRVKANICRFEYWRGENDKEDDKEESKEITGEIYSPMQGPISLWLSFYF
jgi:hypothetical protein